MAEGAINAHSDAPAHTLASLQEKLIHAVSYEELLWRELNRAAGINRAPKVMPVFARARQTFNFDGDTLYSLGTREGNDITWFLVSLARANLIEPRAIPGIEDALGSSFTGTDLYQYLVRSAMVNDGTPNNVSEAKKALAEHLLLMDYDSLKVSQTQGDYGVGEAMVMLKPKNLKHIDADVYDRDVDHIFQSVVESDIKPVGAIASLSKTGFDPLDRSSIPLTLRILQRGGMPTHLAQPVRRMLRQEELSEDDLKILHRGGGFMTFLDELSVRVRRVGAQWFADKMKPLEGFGFYERQAADMSARVAPVLEELNALPDAGGRMKRWARRNAGLAFKDIPQPASHRRIIRALRRGEEEVLRLKPAERQAALNIAHAFESELREMRDLGIAVGDARAYGTDYYVPQVWDIEHIRDHPSEFMSVMKRWFLIESRRDPDLDILNPAQAQERSEELLRKMLINDGVLEGDAHYSSAVSNPFNRRVIRLNAGDYNELGLDRYLVDDLAGLMSKYFDKTSRKKILTEEFGVGGHAYNDYVNTAQTGHSGAVRSLMSERSEIFHQGEHYHDNVDVVKLQIPALSKEQAEMAMDAVVDVMGPSAQSRRANKEAARSILMNALPGGIQNNENARHYARRVDAIVNALVDFSEQNLNLSHNDVSLLNKALNVLNRRPPEGDARGAKHSISRKLRSFNSISLLAFTTLTSAPDMVLPLVRSGRVDSWMKGWTKYMSDPDYRQATRNVGTAIENMLHERLVHMAGEGNQRFANSFFNLI